MGVWKWTGTTIAKSKVEFVGYEEHEEKSVVEECLGKLELVRVRMGELSEERRMEVEAAARALGGVVERTLIVSLPSGERDMC